MRITGWHVDGYGRFRDDGWRDLPTGLTVFHGPNEAGKSTLLSFLHTVLFGFPRANAAQPAIEPLRGGAHGGRVFLQDDDGAEWTVQRRRPGGLRLSGPAGEAGEEELQRLLGHVPREVFRSVFAFGLQELEALGGLDDEAVRRRILAAGLTGVGRSTDDALQELQRRAERLARPRGACVLRAHQDRLAELHDERGRAATVVDQHGELREREAGADDEVRAGEAELRRLADADRRLERLERTWQAVAPLDDAERELADLADGPPVPADAVADLRALEQSLDGVGEQLTERRAAIASRAEARERIAIDPRLVSAAGTARELAGRVPVQRERLAEHRERVAERTRAIADAAAALHRAGPGWDRTAVLAFDGSTAVRAAAANWVARRAEEDDRVRSAEHDRRTAEDAAAEAAEEEAVAVGSGVAGSAAVGSGAVGSGAVGSGAVGSGAVGTREIDAGEIGVGTNDAGRTAVRTSEAGPGRDGRPEGAGDGGAVPLTAAELTRRAAALGRVRVALDELHRCRRDAATERTNLAALEAVADRTDVGATGPSGSDGGGIPALLVVAALTLALGIVLAAAGQPLGGAIVVAVGVAVGAVHRAQVRQARAARRAHAGARDAEARHAERVAEQRRRAEHADRDRSDAEQALRTAATAAGIVRAPDAPAEGLPDHAVLEAAGRRLERDREDRRAADARCTVAEQAARRRATAETRLAAARAALERAREAAAAGRTAWSTWAAGQGLPRAVEPSAAPALLDALAEARGALVAVDTADARVHDGAERIAEWADRAIALLRGAGGDSPPRPRGADDGEAHERLLDAVVALDDAATLAVQTDREHDRSRAADAEDDRVLRGLEARRDAARRARTDLLRRHGVADLAQLRTAEATSRRRAATAAAIAQHRDAVRRAVGRGPEADELLAEARSGDVSGWAARRVAIEEDARRARAALTAAIEARTAARGRREELERDADLARIDGEIEQVRADAAAALAEYRTILRAGELIRDTLAAFVRDRQPEVLRDASRWFERVTDGRYVGVRQGTGADGRGADRQPLRVESASGQGLDPAALSRGTREQLYLCLRLALARSTARKGTPLPLVMDDVLVNFSPDRAEAVAAVLVEVAAEQQVLYFTCHPATRELLVRAGAATAHGPARVEELSRAVA